MKVDKSKKMHYLREVQTHFAMKKHLLLVIALLLGFSIMQAQVLIDHKGNRNQTYPSVTETNPNIVEMLCQVDTVNLYNTLDWMQQYVRDATKP